MLFQRDGCYFLHKDGQYDTDGPTPLALLWKDAACSRYFIDTDASGAVSAHQHVILQYGDDRNVCTGDNPPVVLARMPADFASRTAATLRLLPLPRLMPFEFQTTASCAEHFCCDYRDEQRGCRPGRLLRFTLREGGIQFFHGEPAGADLHFEGAGNQRRGRADTLSKVYLFPQLILLAQCSAIPCYELNLRLLLT